MAQTKVLIAVKTYPTLSGKYDELVCTAGFREDGTWIRIYPIPFRKMKAENQYKKWQWVTLDIVKNEHDPRQESYRPVEIDADFELGETIPTSNNWSGRKPYVFNEVFYNLEELIAQSKVPPYKSLAVLKPTEVLDFVWEPVEREWDEKKLKAIYANHQQLNLFEQDHRDTFTIAKKIPYKFSYVFTTEDGKKRTMMIEDWELGMLYWNCLKSCGGDEEKACQLVKKKYFEEMTRGKDFYFFIGTTKSFHMIAPNPYIIIGTFWPKKEIKEPSLFDDL